MAPGMLEPDTMLCTSDNLFGAVFDAAPEAMIVLDEKNKIFLVNNCLEKLSGYSKLELIGRQIEFLIPDFATSQHQNGHLRTFLEKQLNHINTARHKDGAVFSIVTKSSFLPSDDGDFCCLSLCVIPERKPKEEFWTASEKSFRRFLENLSERYIFYRHDRQGHFTYLSPSLSQVLGYDPKHYQAHFSEMLTDNPINDHVQEHTQRVLDGEAQLSYELEVRAKDGSLHRMEITEYPIFNERGEVEYVEGISHDITEETKAAQLLREREAWLSQGQAIAHLGSFYWDIRTNLATWSDELYRIYGLDPKQESINFESYLSLIHPEFRDQIITAVQSATQEGKAFEHEYRIVRPTGEFRWVFARGEPVRNPQGDLIALQGICHDITERRQAEEALRESQERYRAVIESTADGILINKRGRIVYANPALLRMLGAQSPEQIVGRSPFDILHPDFHVVARERIRAILQTHQSVSFLEERFVRVDGTTVDVEIAAAPFQDQGEIAILVTSRDLTERKRIEAALREERDRFTQIAAIVPGAIHSFRRGPDRSISFPYVSPNIEEIYGISPAPLMEDASRTRAMIHPEDLDLLRKRLDESANNLSNFILEFRVKHPTKGEIWVEGRSAPTRQPDGSVLWHGVLTDVTQRKHAQEELEKERTLLRTLLDTLPDVIFTKDMAGRLVLGNKAHVSLFEATTEAQIAGKTVFDLHPHHLAEGYHADDMLVLQHGQAILNREELIRDSQGHEEWYLVNKIPLRDRNGQITGLVGICRNIQERKQAVESLRASNELFHFVSLATHDAIYDWQIEKGIVWRNETYQKLYSPDKPLGQDEEFWKEHIHPDDRQRVLDSIDLALHTQSPFWSGEYRFQRSDGTYANVMDRGYILFSPEGKPLRKIGAMSDISEFKRLEEQFLQAQKMDAVGQLAGGVAHDFNNLLTTILGYSELLLSDWPAQDPHRFALEEINKSGNRAAALTQQLLAFSRKQMLQPQLLDLNAVVGDITNMLRRLIGEDIHLQLCLSDDLWAVKADPHQLQQVIVNLVVNARDAMPTGGKITIQTRNVEIEEDYVRTHVGAHQGSHVSLTVIDTGLGMTEDVKNRIFEPFFTTKGMGKGTGLGLATVYGIIKQSGGYIGVESTPGAGTTFTILLPREASRFDRIAMQDADLSNASASPFPSGTETVLLVEDEDGVRDLAQLSLISCGYQVLSAKSGEAALSLASQHAGPVHLLFTDLVMPGISGTELADRLRASQPNVKVLFMSGYTGDVVDRHNIALFDKSFLQKPFTHRDLAYKVREALDAE